MIRSTTLATTLVIVLALASTLPGHGSEMPVPDQIGA
jgi:hypothetical protein